MNVFFALKGSKLFIIIPYEGSRLVSVKPKAIILVAGVALLVLLLVILSC